MSVLNVQEVQIGQTGFPISQWNMVTNNTVSEVQENGFLNSSYRLGNYYKQGDFANVETTDSGTLLFQIKVNKETDDYSLILPYSASTAIPDGDLLANISGESAIPLGTTATQYLDYVFGSDQGSLLYRSSDEWKSLPPSTDGYILKTNGPNADPAWEFGTAPIDIPNNDMVANISGAAGPVQGVTATAYLDSAFSNVQGSILYRNGTQWVSLAPSVSGYFLQTQGASANVTWAPPSAPIIANNQLIANISGSSAQGTGTNFTSYLDSVISNQPNSLITRNSTTWTSLPSKSDCGLITTTEGVPTYVDKFPSHLIPIDNYSLVTQNLYSFFPYSNNSTGLFPLQMVAFKHYIVVINNIANTIQTYAIFSGGVVNSISTVATGGNPQALITFSISGVDYLAVTNAADDTFSIYTWNEGGQTWVFVSTIATTATSPRGIGYNLINGTTPALTVAGYVANEIELFTWNGTTFISASTGVSTGTNPGSATGFDFAGSSYFAVVNTAGSSVSVYEYNGTDWALFQTISTASSPLALIFFASDTELFLSVCCSIGDEINCFKLSGLSFIAWGSVTSAGIPVSIDHYTVGNTHYISTVGTFSATLDSYVYDITTGVLTQSGLPVSTGGATPADMVAYTLPLSDGSRLQFISVTNSLSDSMTTFYYASDLISIAPIAANEILANINTSTDIPRGTTLTALLDGVVGATQGALVTRTATGWQELPPGASGQFLQSQGAAANLIWAAGGGGSTTIANNQLLGNISGITAPATGLTLSTFLDSVLTNVQGAIMYRNATAWTSLAPTIPGYFLQTQGSFSNPVWADPLVPVLNNYVLANITGSTNNPRGCPLTDILDSVFGSTVGSLLVRGASSWQILASGASGYFLQSNGVSTLPSWQAGPTNIKTGQITVPDGVTLYAATVTGVVVTSIVTASINEQGGSIYLTKALQGTDEIRFYFSAATSSVIVSYMWV